MFNRYIISYSTSSGSRVATGPMGKRKAAIEAQKLRLMHPWGNIVVHNVDKRPQVG